MRHPSTPTVSVVICAADEDRWNDVVAAVTSVMHQTHHPAEIVLVIDHDPTFLRRATFELPGVRVIPNDRDSGLSGARNAGVAVATSDIIAFLDDGAVAASNWLAQLVTPYGDPRVLGVGGRVAPAWPAGRPAWFPPECDWVIGCGHRGRSTARDPVRHLTGSNMSLRRELLVESGGCIRVQRRHPGGIHICEPKAIVRQSVRRDQCTWSYFRAACFSAGVSTAVFSDTVGRGRVLSVERSRLRSVVPSGVGSAIRAVVRGQPSAVIRVLTLTAGVVIGCVGYLVGTARSRWAARGRRRRVKSTQVRLARPGSAAPLPLSE